jgi:hypothetical protein
MFFGADFIVIVYLKITTFCDVPPSQMLYGTELLRDIWNFNKEDYSLS